MDKLMSSFCSISLCFHFDWHGSSKRVRGAAAARCGFGSLKIICSPTPISISAFGSEARKRCSRRQSVCRNGYCRLPPPPHTAWRCLWARGPETETEREIVPVMLSVRRSTYARRLLNDSQTAIWNLFDAILIVRCVRVTHCYENTPCPARLGSFWISFICQRSLDGFTCVCQSVYVCCTQSLYA